MLSGSMNENLSAISARLQEQHVPATLANAIASLKATASACDIAIVARDTKQPIQFIGKIYFALGERLGFNWLRSQAAELKGENYWQRLALRNIIDSINSQQRRLTLQTAKAAAKNSKPAAAIDAFSAKYERELERHGKLIAELKATERTDLGMLVAAARRIETMC